MKQEIMRCDFCGRAMRLEHHEMLVGGVGRYDKQATMIACNRCFDAFDAVIDEHNIKWHALRQVEKKCETDVLFDLYTQICSQEERKICDDFIERFNFEVIHG